MQGLMNKVVEQLMRDTPYNNGADSYFVEITSEVGAKLFMSPLMRDRNYDRFVKYAEVAPKVGRKFEIQYEGRQMWGFLVEMVEVEHAPLDGEQLREIRLNLSDIACRRGWNGHFADMHPGNVGRRKRTHEPLIIDFSRFIDDDGFCYHSLSGWIEARINGDWHRIELTKNGTAWRLK